MAGAIDLYLIAGGLYHDIDFARLELLRLFAEHERVRVTVAADYSDVARIAAADVLVTYTCAVVPRGAEIEGPRRFLARGRRWFALHGTNSVLQFRDDGRVDCPPLEAQFLDMVGSQFMAHPPIGRYKVRAVAKDDPLIRDVGDFHVEDEHYLQDMQTGNIVLMSTRFAGRTDQFVRDTWEDGEHPVLYRRDTGGGSLLYLTLGHARGRYDMRPLTPFYPLVERGAWTLPVFYTLLRRGLAWTLAEL